MEWMILKWIILFPSSYTSKGGEEETKKEKKKHLWGSSSVIATGGFSSTDFRFQEKLYIINGVSMTHVHTRMEMVGKEEKKNQTIDRICYFAGLYRTSAETVLQIAI
jgi:hypothetical protein